MACYDPFKDYLALGSSFRGDDLDESPIPSGFKPENPSVNVKHTSDGQRAVVGRKAVADYNNNSEKVDQNKSDSCKPSTCSNGSWLHRDPLLSPLQSLGANPSCHNAGGAWMDLSAEMRALCVQPSLNGSGNSNGWEHAPQMSTLSSARFGHEGSTGFYVNSELDCDSISTASLSPNSHRENITSLYPTYSNGLNANDPLFHQVQWMVRNTLLQNGIVASARPGLLEEGRFCVFCKNNKETKEFYMTHVVKDGRGKVICPVLRKYTCPICKSTGDNAHTLRHCPLRARLQ